MSKRKHILLIDDEEGMCRMVEAVLGDSGYVVESFTRSFEAMEVFEAGKYDVVVTDIKMPGLSGLEVLQRVKDEDPGLPVIMITAYATVEMSIQAMRKGAYDMLTKPFEPEELLYRVRNALRQTELTAENRELRQELAEKTRFESIVGDSEALLAVLETARKVAARDIPVLLTGESGTGKELVARAIHHYSPRRDGKFVAINCGALPQSLLESELFGHRKGAFTGADQDRRGLLQEADGGTLFLDEVGNLPMNVQKALLRFLQEREFYRVGESRPTRVDVRVISATNSDLHAAVEERSFREDLYYRFNVAGLHIPPLRERRSDIPLLIARFLKEQNERFGTHVKGLTAEALDAVRSFDWPGNIRQLKNVIEASMAVEQGDYLGLDVLRQFADLGGGESTRDDVADPLDYATALAKFETGYLEGLLNRTCGNVEEAARRAGMNIATVYRKMKKHGIRKNTAC